MLMHGERKAAIRIRAVRTGGNAKFDSDAREDDDIPQTWEDDVVPSKKSV